MELTFGNALFIAGSFLFLVGVLTEASYLAGGVAGTGFSEMLSYGMNSAIFSLFSGVMLGAGTVMLTDSAIMRLRTMHARIAFIGLLAGTSLCIAVVSFSQTGEQQILFLIAFFASCTAFFGYTISFILSVLCVLGHRLVSDDGPLAGKCAHLPSQKPKPSLKKADRS
jgi:hypothetical protein